MSGDLSRAHFSKKWLAALAFAGAVAGSLFLLKLITPETFTGYDGNFYEAMTRELFSKNPRAGTAPYCYRLFPACLLHFVPLVPRVSYSLFNALAYAAAAGLFFSLFRALGYGLRESSLGVFFFLFSWITVRFGFFYPAQVDPAYYLILAAAFSAAYQGWNWLFFLALLAGALTREYFITLIPVYYFARRAAAGAAVQRCNGAAVNRRVIGRTLLFAGIPVMIFVALKILIRPANADFSYSEHAAEFARLFVATGRRIVHSYFNVYGVLLFIILLRLPGSFRFLFRRPGLFFYLVISTALLVIGGADRCRINAVAFPVFLILGLEAMKARPEVYARTPMVAFLVGAHLFLNRVLSPMTAENYRRIWWSEVSFCPEEVFRSSSRTYLLVFIAFVLLYAGFRFRARMAKRGSIEQRA